MIKRCAVFAILIALCLLSIACGDKNKGDSGVFNSSTPTLSSNGQGINSTAQGSDAQNSTVKDNQFSSSDTGGSNFASSDIELTDSSIDQPDSSIADGGDYELGDNENENDDRWWDSSSSSEEDGEYSEITGETKPY